MATHSLATASSVCSFAISSCERKHNKCNHKPFQAITVLKLFTETIHQTRGMHLVPRVVAETL